MVNEPSVFELSRFDCTSKPCSLARCLTCKRMLETTMIKRLCKLQSDERRLSHHLQYMPKAVWQRSKERVSHEIWDGTHFLQDCMCSQWRLRSACAYAQSDLGLRGHSVGSQGSALKRLQSNGKASFHPVWLCVLDGSTRKHSSLALSTYTWYFWYFVCDQSSQGHSF